MEEEEPESFLLQRKAGCGKGEPRGVPGGSSEVAVNGFELNFRKAWGLLGAVMGILCIQDSCIPSCLMDWVPC